MLDRNKLVFECEEFVIFDVSDELPKHRNYPQGAHDIIDPTDGQPAVRGSYRERRGGAAGLKRIVIHQTAGSVSEIALNACLSTAKFFVRDPSWALKEDGKYKWTGKGRGYPAMGYTWFVPYQPTLYKGIPVIYQVNPLNLNTWHTTGWNDFSGGLVFQGLFPAYPYEKGFVSEGVMTSMPSKVQLSICSAFMFEYAFNVLGIGRSGIYGHYHAGKPTCPGYALAELIEEWRQMEPLKGDRLVLSSWRDRQAALFLLGEDLKVDGIPGPITRLTIEHLEKEFGLPVDGVWDAAFNEKVVDRLLKNFKTEDVLCRIQELQK